MRYRVFKQFLQERVYLKGISRQTAEYYKWVGKAFESILDNPTKQGALACIKEMRDRGVSAISVNSYLRGFNAYLMWLHTEHGKERIKLPKLKEEQHILQTLSNAQ